MTTLYKKFGGTGLLIVAVAMSGDAAHAQNNESAGPSTVLEEVFVSARKTEEAAQDLPISLTALSGLEVENKVVLDVQDLQNVVPGLNVSTNSQGGAPIFAIRGNATQNNIEGGVVVYFNEVPVDSTFIIAKGFYDIASVEVLKGPQGTQFGANTTGGTISVRPTKPTDEFEGFIEAGYGDYDRRELTGMINIPVNDMTKFRFAGNSVKRDGYVNNELHGGVRDKRYFSDDYYSFRASMRMEGENWTSDLIYDYFREDDQRNPHVPVVFSSTSVPGSSPADFGERLGKRGKVYVGPNPSGQISRSGLDIKLKGIQHVLTIDFNDNFSLRNVVGYRDDFEEGGDNSGGTSLYLVEVLTRYWREQWTEDLTLRFNALDNRLRFDVGAFYKDATRDRGVVAAVVQNIMLATTGLPLAVNIRNYQTRKFESKSVYANFDFDATERVNLFAGYRYNWDEGSLNFSSTNIVGLPDVGEDFFPDESNPCHPPSLGGFAEVDLDNCIGRNEDKWTEASWTAGANFQLAEDTLTYAKVSHGYIAGGFNPGLREVPSFEPETTLQYEVGLKSEWEIGGRPLRTNIAVFFGEIEDKQTRHNTNYDDGGSAGAVLNAAKQDIEGLDLEVQFSPVDGLTLDARYTYLDAEFKEFSFPATGGNGDGMTGVTLTPARDLSGESPAEIPNHQLSIGANYLFPTDPNLGDINLSLSTYYSDDMLTRNTDNTGEFGKRFITLDSYWTTSASLSWDQIGGSSFGARLWIQNIFDEEIENFRDVQFPTFGYGSVKYGAPRVYGASLRYSF